MEVSKKLLMDLRSRCYFLVAMRFWETPVHIPNTMVKTKAADDTILVTVWESRWLPDQQKTSQLCRLMILYRTGTGSANLDQQGSAVLDRTGFTSD